MIIAVLEYVETVAARDNATPPKDLALYWQIQRYGLPFAGGFMDQPAGMLRRSETAGNVYEAYSSWYTAPSRSGWQARNPQGALVVGAALKMRRYG